MPRLNSRYSKFLSDSAKRPYIITARWSPSGDELKYRNGCAVRSEFAAHLPYFSSLCPGLPHWPDKAPAYVIRQQDGARGLGVMSWDVLGGAAPWPMTNVRNLALPQWKALASKPDQRCLIPLTEFCEWTPDKHDLGDGKPKLKGEMWFQFMDQPVFAVAGFWQHTKEGTGFAMVTCDPNALVAPIHPKAMITILQAKDHEKWLTGTLADVVALQRPYDGLSMTLRGPVFPTRSAR